MHRSPERKTRHLTPQDLTKIREGTDIRALFNALGIETPVMKGRELWSKSPFKDEKEASFHFKEGGGKYGTWAFKDFSSGGMGGGVLEIVEDMVPGVSNCYEAGWWIIENGLTTYIPECIKENRDAIAFSMNKTPPDPEQGREPSGEKEKTANEPIRQDLRYAFLYEHPEFVRRGISPKTMEELGAGFLPADKTKAIGLKDRFVFQVRGVQGKGPELKKVILTHIGRASTEEQTKGEQGRWWIYPGFKKSLDIYGMDNLLLEPAAIEQVKKTGRVLIVEGCFDVAKLFESGIRNAVATFGAHLYEGQLARLRQIMEELRGIAFLVWYDRDPAGREGQERALALLRGNGIIATGFDWGRTFASSKRRSITFPETIKDPCDCSVAQLQWLREKGLI